MSNETKRPAAKPYKTYLAVVAVYHGKDKRDAPGEPYTGPKDSIPWLLEQGHITEGDR